MTIEPNTLIHGDCMNVMRKMPDNSVYLTLTDIPYNEVNRPSNGLRNFDKGAADVLTFDLNQFLNEVIRITVGSIYIFCSTEQVSDIRKHFNRSKLTNRQCLWAKKNPSPVNGQHMWLSGAENCMYAKKPKAVFNEHCKSNVWFFPSGRNKHHPTEKPLKLMEYLIQVSSNEDDIVFDPCMGGGSTMVAAKNMNRKYFGVELNEKWHQTALERLK